MMKEEQSLYDVLKVPRNAKPHVIKAAYRAEAMRHHPDRLPPTATEEEKAAALESFQKLQDAYDILMDRERREQYDLSGQIPKSKQQLAMEATSFILQAFTSVVDQITDMMVQNPALSNHIRSPVSIIDDSINERIVACQSAVRKARDKRNALKRVIRGLKRKDGADAGATSVMVGLNDLVVKAVKAIVYGEAEIEMLRVALKLNAEWDYTKPAPSGDDYDAMVQIMRLAYGDEAVQRPTAEDESVDGDDEEWPEWGEDDGAEPEERAA